MQLPKTSGSTGSAVVEFIVFLLFGQLLVFSIGMQVSQWIDTKLKLELAAQQQVRALALGKGAQLLAELSQDLPDMVVSALNCSAELVCVTLKSGSLAAFQQLLQVVKDTLDCSTSLPFQLPCVTASA